MTLPEPLLAWWSARESREQRMLLVGAAFAVAAAAYALVYPVFEMHATAGREFQAADGDYHWLKQQVRALGEMRSEAGGALPVSLPLDEAKAKIESDLKKRKMKATVAVRNADGAKHIEVEFESSSGREVMRWLEALTNGGYTVSGLDLSNSGGRLSGTVVIEV